MDKIIAFFVDLYEKFLSLTWVQLLIKYCKKHPTFAGITVALLVLIIAVLCILGTKSKKAKKLVQKQATLTANDSQPTPAEDNKETPVATEKPAETEEPIVEEVEPAETEEPIVEEVEPTETEIIEQEPMDEDDEDEFFEDEDEFFEDEEEFFEDEEEFFEDEEEFFEDEDEFFEDEDEFFDDEAETPIEEDIFEKTQETPAKKAPAKKTANYTHVTDVDETLAMLEDMDEDEAFMLDHYDEDEIDRLARSKGKWVVCRMITNDGEYGETFFFELHAANGEKLLESEEFSSYQGALRGIQTHKANILKVNFKITTTKAGEFTFKLLSGKNMLLCTGGNYSTRARCQSTIDAAIRFASTAILDENVQDVVVKVPQEENIPVPPLSLRENGKWIISTGLNAEEKKIYYFELYSDSGEKLLESEEYTTYTGAVNGIRTHKKNIENNNFRISLTKKGDYVYKLVNANGQLLFLGERYKTKTLCKKAVEEVKYFAMNSPMLTDENIE